MSAWLRQAVVRTGNQFPWYGEWLTRSGSPLGETVILEEIPLLTAPVLESYYYAEPNRLADREDLNRYRTSGTSSGRRKTIYYSASDEEAYLRIKLDVFRTILDDHAYRTAVSDVGTGHAEATAVEVFRLLGMEVESLSFQDPIERHLERLAEFRPEVLYTMPSILERILLASADAAAYGIRHVVLVGEIASPGWIRRAAQRLGLGAAQITDTYGSIEIGTIAFYSHPHGRYLFAEGIIAEGIGTEELEGDFEPLADPEEQVLVLTSVVRDMFPAMRYVTYDVVRDLRPVEINGEQRMSFHSVVKRIGPELKHGEKISLYDIEEAVYRHVQGANVRVVVSGSALTLHVEGPQLQAEVLERIRREVEGSIPEIGMMIQAGLLERIQVYGGTFDDLRFRHAVKSKKIIYETKEGWQ